MILILRITTMDYKRHKLKVVPWPLQSPDLKIIGNLWKYKLLLANGDFT